MSELQTVVNIVCACGWNETVTEPKHGQCLGGVAGEKAARHSCKYENGQCPTPNDEATMRFHWSVTNDE